jgi:tetrahydromethanopterin S-methyltransferase subunit C
MSRHSKAKARQQAISAGLPWIVPSLFLGLLAGGIDEAIHGLSMFRMAGGALVGLLIGAAADFIRGRARKRTTAMKLPHAPRGKPT